MTEFEATNARKRRSLVVKWFRRYAVGCLIAVLLFSGRDSYNRPGEDMRYGAILMVAAGRPVVTAIVVGSTIGDIVHHVKQGKAG
jgi:hypothetical protein